MINSLSVRRQVLIKSLEEHRTVIYLFIDWMIKFKSYELFQRGSDFDWLNELFNTLITTCTNITTFVTVSDCIFSTKA